MKGFYLALLGLIGILLGAAFIAPILAQFLDYPFPRVLSRTVLVLFAILGAILIWKTKAVRLGDYGLFWDKGSLGRFFIGLGLGFFVLLAMSVIEMPFGVRVWQITFFEINWPAKLLKYIASALAVAVFEETLFRGLLFGALKRSTRLVSALLLTNLVYSLSHFLRYSGEKIFEHPTFLSSLEIYGQIGSAFLDPAGVLPGAIGLFLFGCVLSLAYLRTGNLLASMGIHAGAVLFLKLDKWFIHVETEAQKFIFGGTDLHASVLGWVFVAGLGVLVLFVFRGQKRAEGA